MAIDATRELVEASDRQRPAELDAQRQSEVQAERAEARLPTAVERIEAHQEARVARDRAYAKLIGQEISAGHAFDKHVVERGEFPGLTTRGEFADIIEGVVMKGEPRVLSGARTAYWSEGTLVIRNPAAPDGGTAFRPTAGHDYFLGLH